MRDSAVVRKKEPAKAPPDRLMPTIVLVRRAAHPQVVIMSELRSLRCREVIRSAAEQLGVRRRSYLRPILRFAGKEGAPPDDRRCRKFRPAPSWRRPVSYRHRRSREGSSAHPHADAVEERHGVRHGNPGAVDAQGYRARGSQHDHPCCNVEEGGHDLEGEMRSELCWVWSISDAGLDTPAATHLERAPEKEAFHEAGDTAQSEAEDHREPGGKGEGPRRCRPPQRFTYEEAGLLIHNQGCGELASRPHRRRHLTSARNAV